MAHVNETEASEPAIDDDRAELSEYLAELQVSQFLGRTLRQVHRYIAEGRLVNLANPGKRKKFARGDVCKLASELKAERAIVSKSPDMVESDNVEKQIRADAVVSIMAGAQNHSEEFFRLSKDAMRDANETLRKLVGEMQSFHAREYKRLTDRIGKLEDDRAEYIGKLDEMQRALQDDEEKRENRKLIRETFVEGKAIAKAIIAAKMRGTSAEGAAGKIQASSVDDFLQSLSEEQMDGIMRTLKPEQIGVLMAIAQSTKAVAEGGQENGKAKP